MPQVRRLAAAGFAIITCILVAGSGIYATFFSLYFLAVATLIGYSRSWRFVRLVDGAIVGVLLFGLPLSHMKGREWDRWQS